MRYILILVVFLSGTFSAISSCPSEGNTEIISLSGQEQQVPFSFFNPVPARIRTTDRVDLSFSSNNAIVNKYRYMIQVPDPGATSVSKTMLNWSQWSNNAFTDIIITKIPQQGKHTLIIEYRVYGSTDIRKFETSFDIYNGTGEAVVNIGTATRKGKATVGETVTPATEDTLRKSDFETMLAEAIEKNDKALLLESIQNGAGLDFKGQHGGNLFHIFNDKLADEQLMGILVARGFSINKTDNFGNTPLHIAVMARDKEYIRALVNHGADPDIMNNIQLSPLHLAAFLNDSEMARDLLGKGAEVDIKGNSGYTPLHIASMMNNIEVVRDLVNVGARAGIKTDQKLNPLQIAGIQDNRFVRKVIKSKGQFNLNQIEAGRTANMTRMDQVRLNPQFDINLLYNKELLKKRRFNKVIGIISIPVLAAGTAGTIYFNSEAEKNYSSYKTAETMELARHYYDKTLEFDTYSYISGGLSLTSVFGIVYSAIKRENISDRMRKTLY
ncbi:MAG: ankyrin repeat domain-containing protein [Bacteroidales bacterium]